MIPQSPLRRTPGRASGNPLSAARKDLYKKWVTEHPATDGDAALMDLPLTTFEVRDLPFGAPHYVERLLADGRNGGKFEIQADKCFAD